MLVEDELPLLQLLERYLKRVGYEVRTFSASSVALREFEANPESYDLVIADLGMPEMPGDTMLMRMLAIKPALLVLICSGSPFYLSTMPRELEKQVGFLQKPFLPKMLLEAVEGLLGKR